MAPSHYLNQCWNIVNWNLRNKLQWNFNRNSNIFIQEYALDNVVCEMASILSRPQCVDICSAFLLRGLIYIIVNIFHRLFYANSNYATGLNVWLLARYLIQKKLRYFQRWGHLRLWFAAAFWYLTGQTILRVTLTHGKRSPEMKGLILMTIYMVRVCQFRGCKYLLTRIWTQGLF